ncbi:MAG: M48 family metallopeptidase [Bacilli bacterium]|nr:M48 family metallopeptidase [Bacilli bacterium]
MRFDVGDSSYEVVVSKKRSTKNTYIRVKDDLKIYVTTNYFTSKGYIETLINNNRDSIIKMINKQMVKNENNSDFHFLGKRYEIVYTDSKDVYLGENKVFLNKCLDIDKWYKKQAKVIFKSRIDDIYKDFSASIDYPDLRIRKMTTRWGVCNTKSKTVTLNLELIKRDLKYLDYVIVHELSHLVYANHSKEFWSLVEDNCSGYKRIRNEMKYF